MKRSPPILPTCLNINVNSDLAIHKMVADYFDADSFGVRSAPTLVTKTDERALNILRATTKRVDGRFQTGLLWRDDNIELPDSYAMAERRMIAIERKMKRDEVFAYAYNALIRSYLDKNYARKLQPAEAAVIGPRTWYLPHFAVVNPNKPKKLRIVFDAAATVNGISLNSNLLKELQQYQSMPSVFFNFRIGAIAVCGDIKEMFLQIMIQPKDRYSQRFLWRYGKEDQPPDIYEMMVMRFGAACSPCSAQHVKIVNAMVHHDHDPRAIKAITHHHYVDDFVDSYDSIEHAIKITKQVCDIHKDAGFELRNFTSNSPEVVKALDGVTKTTVWCNHLSETSAPEKILGMYWQPLSDNFRYQLKFHRVDTNIMAGTKCPTKRELLSIAMSVFDPLGFLCHFIIAAKLMMREVWRYRIGWDEPLPIYICAAWEKWRQSLNDVTEISISRCYFLKGPPSHLRLHVFVDPSEEAFPAVAYWRVINADNEINVSFVCAKSRCAPLRPMTIPRLELQAAVLGTRLMQTIIEEHSLSVTRVILWSDSSTVIKWIESESRRYKPFVAYRIAEIIAATKMSNWKWLPGHEIVADETTRANCQSMHNCNSSRWLKIPPFLVQHESTWPAGIANISNQEQDSEEFAPKFALLIVSCNVINFNRFSSFIRMNRAMAWVMRFISRCQKKGHDHDEYGLTAAELDAAENVLCPQAQAEAFAAELCQIKNKECLNKNSMLYKLSPYIEEGLLRVYGRIDAASWLPYNRKRPIILPPEHVFTSLLVRQHHIQMKHQNIEATICEIRRKYWIPRLRQVMRKVIGGCFVCKLTRATPVTPIMGPLPTDRLTPFVRPFSYTGLDYFDPLTVTIGRRTEKRWVALFTCLTVRAIHLEVARDLSTDACIVVMSKFINRRGVPVRIRSDNGKNFVGADNEAQRFSEVFDCERIQNELSSRGIQWVFNCPNNPSEGGIWERMVQCVKKVLRHTLKEVSPREHTLQCFVIAAENVVNSRPLTHLPVAVDQEEPLTPNHFLLGTANTAQTPAVNLAEDRECALREQWRIARLLRNRFWKRWVSEYLPTLTRRVKWCQKTEPLEEGALVFICDASIPRREWSRGKVERVYPGVDGEIRRADVRTSSGVLCRPVSKLAVLDLEYSESS